MRNYVYNVQKYTKDEKQKFFNANVYFLYIVWD